MIAHGPGRFRFRQAERRWPSVIVSVAITALSFALAFGSMWSIPRLTSRERLTQDVITTIRLPTPAPPKPEAVVQSPRVATREPQRREVSRAPAIVPPPVTTPVPVVSPLAVPAGTPNVARDSAATLRNATTDSASSGSGAPRRSGKGASIEPAGISLTNRAANTPAVRDSIARSKLEFIPGLAATRAPTGRERAELEQSQRAALALRQRTLTAGNSSGLTILQGKGMNGVGAVDPTSSIPFTLFSSGPTREQRKKNEAIDADYQLRLRRLEDRMLLKRDSIRADSLRADSLRRRNPR